MNNKIEGLGMRLLAIGLVSIAVVALAWAVGVQARTAKASASVAPPSRPVQDNVYYVSAKDRFAQKGTQRSDIAEARSHLSFDPILPDDVNGRGQLVGLYTLSEKDSVKNDKGLDTVTGAIYEGDLQVVEKQWDPKVVCDEKTYADLVQRPFGDRAGEVVRTTSINGVTVWMWDPVDLPESKDAAGDPLPGIRYANAQVNWYADGIGHMIASPNLKADDLLGMAKTMLK